jgi:putative spermidine/putrescine transport system substrate-binding protein
MKIPAALAAATAALVVISGCASTDGGSGGSGADQLVVSGFSFGAEDFEKNVIKPFEEKTGIDVTFDSGSNSDRYNKLLVSRANPDTDVMLISDVFAADGERNGVFSPLDPATIPNMANTVDFARPAGAGDNYGAPYTFTLLGMLYSTTTFGNAPPTVASLWDPKYAGKIAVPDISSTAGIPFLMAVAETFGSGPQDIETAFAKLAELKPSVLQFYSSTTELLSLIERGEVVAAPGLDLFAYDAVEAGSQLMWAPLDHGKLLSYNKAEMVAGSPNPEAAQKFIDYLLSADVQTQNAAAFSDKPVNRDATVPPVMAKVSGPAASDPAAAGFTPLDLAFVSGHRADWIDAFARRVSG